jgi:hypothetical protein
MKQMKITIRKDGTQKIVVLGAAGPECLAFTQEVERRLGSQEGERELKPEFEASETEAEHDHEAGT